MRTYVAACSCKSREAHVGVLFPATVSRHVDVFALGRLVTLLFLEEREENNRRNVVVEPRKTKPHSEVDTFIRAIIFKGLIVVLHTLSIIRPVSLSRRV